MTYEKNVVIAVVAVWLAFMFSLAVPSAEAATLPANLPKSKCSTLNHLHGKKKWKHYLWHLCSENKAKYLWLSGVIQRESSWNPGAHNPYSSAAGLPQFLSSWYSGRWHFDPHDPILSLRVMVYVWNRDSLGGYRNWILTA